MKNTYLFNDNITYPFIELGNNLCASGKDINKGRMTIRDSRGRYVSNKNLRCIRCKRKATEDGHDSCLANLPGVKYACCGHGIEEGYISFENGITIRGTFEVDDDKKFRVKK
jgi:hypothetical protein